MPRHSSGQPGAMVTDRDRQRTWGVGRVFAILTACALLIGLGYLMAASAALPIKPGIAARTRAEPSSAFARCRRPA